MRSLLRGAFLVARAALFSHAVLSAPYDGQTAAALMLIFVALSVVGDHLSFVEGWSTCENAVMKVLDKYGDEEES